MIRLRIRRWGWEEWTLLTFEGEIAEQLSQLLISRVLDSHDVQVCEDGEWESLNG